MKAAFPVWNDIISPVFDVAREVRIVKQYQGSVGEEVVFSIATESPVERISLLVRNDVDELICGAISRPLYHAITHCGIRVIPFISGEYKKVLDAWLTGRLHNPVFVMPGCRRARITVNPLMEADFMNGGKKQGGGGQGGSGPGFRWRRRGQGAGPDGFCVCSACGYRKPHERGVPCAQEKCPKCGAPMFRE